MLSFKIRVLVIISLLVMSISPCKGQIIFGHYYDTIGHFITIFSDGNIQFCLPQSSCFGEETVMGKGSFHIRKEKILIKIKNGYQEGSKSTYFTRQDTNESNENLTFSVVDKQLMPLPNVYITYFQKKKQNGVITDNDGNAVFTLPFIPDDSLIYINKIGFQSLLIKPEKFIESKFQVQLAEGNFRYVINKHVFISFENYGDSIGCRYLNDPIKTVLVRNHKSVR